MNGIVIDFDVNKNMGLILAEDGNRYEFDLTKWKSKTKKPEIDSEVNFILKGSIATDIYSLSKRVDEEKINANIQNKIYSDIKKINFNEIEEIGNKEAIDDATFHEDKKLTKKAFFKTILVLVVEFIILQISIEARSGGFALFLTIIIIITIIIGLALLTELLTSKEKAKENSKKEAMLKEYKKQLKIINYTPHNLEFENLEIIHASGENIKDAEENLIKQAFTLKADAIINYSSKSNAISNVKSDASGKIFTKVNVVEIVSGQAVKIK